MKYIVVFFISLTVQVISGQNALKEYINIGLENNLALRQKESSFRQSLEALNEARGLFYPNISLNARYTISEGGRVIDFPVGDLMNPVYSTLNQLTSSNIFPQIENQEIRFLRPTEHETRLRLVQPVFNTDIYYNAKIRKEFTLSEEISLEQYKRELVAEIKKAYYTVGMTGNLLDMFRETRPLLLENIRVNSRLIENNKITMENLLRSRTELSKFEQRLQTALKDLQVATAYFNFLLNKPLNDTVIIEDPLKTQLTAISQQDFKQEALNNREEIKNIEKYGQISELTIQMNRSSRLPDISLLADYGFQGETYQFNKNHDYMQASVVLSWDLFSGFQNKTRIRQSIIRKEMIDRQIDEIKSQIELQVIRAMNELKASEAGITAADSQVKSAREGFRLVRRKFEEGQASLIEFMDARNSLTQAEENRIISHFTYMSNYAELEKVTTSFNTLQK